MHLRTLRRLVLGASLGWNLMCLPVSYANSEALIQEARDIVAKWTFDQCYAYANQVVYGKVTNSWLVESDAEGFELYLVRMAIDRSIVGVAADSVQFWRWYYRATPEVGGYAFQCLCRTDETTYDPNGRSSFSMSEAVEDYISGYDPPRKIYWDKPLCSSGSPGKPSKGPMMAVP